MINISSRIRNAMVGLSIALSLIFAAFIFLLTYIIEDQVFINQINLEKNSYERSDDIHTWQPTNANIKLFLQTDELPSILKPDWVKTFEEATGVYEYFDSQHALFIAHFKRSDTGQAYFLVYDVKNVLAVRESKSTLLVFIVVMAGFIGAVAVIIAHRLSRTTLAPVKKLSTALNDNDIDEVVIDLAHDFSDDDIGKLAHGLALALRQARDAAQREFEFNQGVSHELRSPIQVAQSATDLLELNTKEQHAKAIGRLRRSISDMNEIVEAFLWLASEKVLTHSDRCSVVYLRQRIDDIVAARPDITIKLNCPLPEPHTFSLPKQVLSMILKSLINNAIIHGDSTDDIHVHLSEKQLSVSNKVEPNPDASAGFNIGLAITRRLCERFNCQLLTRQNNHFAFCIEIKLPKN